MSEVVGVIPAAGRARRLAPFPCHKELFPLGQQMVLVNGCYQRRPKVASQYLIESMVSAGVNRLFVILGEGKHEIMEYYGNGRRLGIHIAYLFQEELDGLPSALNLISNWLRDETVLFGMPDTILEPPDVFTRLLRAHREDEADVSLGLFRASNPSKFGMVELDPRHAVVHIVDKPTESKLEYMWGIGCWSQVFTEFLASWVGRRHYDGREMLLSDAFQEAVDVGLRVKGVVFDDGDYIDIGTPDDLYSAVRRCSES